MAKYEDIGDECEVETKVSTEAGTETESETGSERLVNLCDIVKDVMEKQVDDEEEKEELSIEEARQHLKGLLSSAAIDGRLLAAAQQLKQKQQEEKDLEITRAKVRNILFNGACDGRLENAFAQAKEEKLEKARMKVKDALVKGACGGHLEHAMMHVKKMREEEKVQDLREKAGQLLQNSALNGSLAQALAEAKQATKLGAVRQTAWKVFANAVENGNLEKALEEVSSTRKSEEKTSETNIMDLRKDAGSTLVNAMKSGNLEKALKEATIDKLRAKTRECLLSASYDGRLEAACSTLPSLQEPPKMSVNELRQMVSKTLTKGLEENRLEPVFQQVADDAQKRAALASAPAQAQQQEKIAQPDPIDSMRLACKELLANAAGNGRLEGVLQEVRAQTSPQPPQEADPVEDLRRQAGNLLFKAAENGQLKELLSQCPKMKEEVSAEPPAPSSQLNIEALRAKARNVFTEAAYNGSLEAAFEKKPPQEEVEAEGCRAKARDLLLRALHNGHLEKTLQSQAQPAATAVEAARLKARELFKSAISDGNLEQVFTEIRSAKSRTSQTSQMEELDWTMSRTAKKVEGGEDLKKRTLGLLSNAALDGRLQSALTEVQQARRNNADVENVRNAARKTIIEGAMSGRLQAACSKVQQENAQAQAEDVRAKARRTLLEAAASGALEQKCFQVKQEKDAERAEVLRSSAKNTLTSCLLNGRLEAAVMEVKKAKEEAKTEDLRSDFRKSLVESVFSGRLEKVCKEVREEVDKEQKDDVEQESKAAVDVEAARLQLRDVFSKAANDGNLGLAFQSMVKRRESKEVAPPGTHVERLRFEVRDALFDAAVSGKLQSLLLETMEAPAPETTEESAPTPAPAPLAEEAPIAPVTVRVPTPTPPPEEERTPLDVEDKEIELIDEDTKAVMPMRPQVAKGTVRPSRFNPRKVSKEVVPPVQSDEVQEEKSATLPPLAGTSMPASHLSSSSRSKRRIFGSFTRTQAEAEEEQPVEAGFTAVSHTASRHSIRRLQAEAPRGLSLLGSPPQRRSSSTGTSAKAASAMAMDLGLEAETSTVPKAPRSFSHSAKPRRFSKDSDAPTSSFLPSLSGKQMPSQSLAPSFALGADVSKWDLSRAVF